MKGVNLKSNKRWTCPNLASAIISAQHNEEPPVPVFDVLPQITLSSIKKGLSPEDDPRDKEFSVETLPLLFSQVELKDPVCDLSLPKYTAELLASRV